MTRLNTEQQALLDTLERADAQVRTANDTAEARIRRMVEDEIEALSSRRDVAAYLAAAGGVPVAQISQYGMHTKDRQTARDAIRRGGALTPDAPIATAVAEDTGEVVAVEFERTPTGTILYRPVPEVLAPILQLLDVAPGDHWAEFTVEDDRLIAVTPGFTVEHGRNPVVALVMGESGREYRSRILAWHRVVGE